jgi:hypothetical protein
LRDPPPRRRDPPVQTPHVIDQLTCKQLALQRDDIAGRDCAQQRSRLLAGQMPFGARSDHVGQQRVQLADRALPLRHQLPATLDEQSQYCADVVQFHATQPTVVRRGDRHRASVELVGLAR